METGFTALHTVGVTVSGITSAHCMPQASGSISLRLANELYTTYSYY